MAISLDVFMQSMDANAPPGGASAALRALWCDARGDWDGAHRLVMAEADADSAWVHAYLHRKEGDPSNAAHWYGRAQRPSSDGSLESEWRAIVEALTDA